MEENDPKLFQDAATYWTWYNEQLEFFEQEIKIAESNGDTEQTKTLSGKYAIFLARQIPIMNTLTEKIKECNKRKKSEGEEWKKK